MEQASPSEPEVDVVVVGAGFAGLYAVHKVRDKMGLSVRAIEAGADVGGTWFWNRYPGARCDIESVHYSYSFDDGLQQEWQWTEKFAGQPEILRYLSHVADRFDLRKSISFNTRVIAMHWDDEYSVWRVTLDSGEVVTSRFVISGAGNLSVPKTPEFGGIERFRGQVLLTGNWPHDKVDFEGRRVAVIGTGASGIQAIPLIAEEAAELVVFQRTPNFATPLGNGPIDTDEVADVKARYADVRDAARNHFLGVPFTDVQLSALAVSAEERRRVFDERWDAGGFRLFIDAFEDILFDKDANDTVAEYIRMRIRERVTDPATARLLAPEGYAYGTKRPPLETNYYEAFNRDNVKIVDVKSYPIDEITEVGVRVGDTVHEVDTIVLATGFDAMTGPLLAMDIRGRAELRLADKWVDGPRTYLGLMISGFPNLFTITGPQSPSVLYNMPLAIEDHIEFVAEAMTYMRERGLDVIEATAQAEERWGHLTNEIAEQTLLPNTDSWYMGANIPGKPRVCMVYLGGAPAYRAECAKVVEQGYAGFDFAPSTRDVGSCLAGR
ncbi:NAD(P)/FAD-dependent oxidoreductase [Mycolicibacterium wolinskyi]|uniref:Cyclohexanone monooxygenase n=1 Tax=Mycolicibacterium wolinskyi TaxID=59750 RepID=A0A1X2F5H9_9MYCO|nr:MULTISPECIES: NAD(P)/FAD-dependent oxidoreductase [Mycolicibacterium]MCV7289782.1 NAD(P)/FAD-dependent oxidoreductase [Mycolicibacterium wolinskyi]MCV7296379.1 NAD(P)/FAD-dependent oxidoreductase [Mycolicibacterium goodii]ORX13638.1 cyclohexanone monooxygenase [Mycolicibacterium wolinskyi]